MEKTQVLRGLATVSFYADEHEKAKAWYTEFLGIEPYFSVPGYVEFRLGDYQHELGIIDRRFAPMKDAQQPGGAIVYWHVDDLEATFNRLVAMGAEVHQTITDRSQGKGLFVTASVIDPFGNVLGIMKNTHFLQVLEKNQTEVAN